MLGMVRTCGFPVDANLFRDFLQHPSLESRVTASYLGRLGR